MADLSTRQLTIMTFDGVRLAVPLRDATTIERTAQLQPEITAGHAIGCILSRQQRYPVYALSRRLEVLPALPKQRLLCVCLGSDSSTPHLAIACDSVTALRLDSATAIQPLPACMQYTGTPLWGLCRVAQQLVLVSSADALATYLLNRE